MMLMMLAPLASIISIIGAPCYQFFAGTRTGQTKMTTSGFGPDVVIFGVNPSQNMAQTKVLGPRTWVWAR